MSKKDRARLFRDRICFVCRRPAAEQGVFHPDLMILTHMASCTDRVTSLRRIHDRSARGRWRPIRHLFKLLEDQRTGR